MLWFVWSQVTMAIAEYLIHKYTMHKKVPLLPLWVFADHTIEHHGKQRNDINVDLSFYFHLTLSLPFTILMLYLGEYIGLLALLLTFYAHSHTWTKLHRYIHGLEYNYTRIYLNRIDHHLGHHANPKTNFGVVYLWPDLIFGTKNRIFLKKSLTQH